MFCVRDVEPKDLEDLYRLSRQAVFLNLPSDKKQLTKLIARSQASFKPGARSLDKDKYIFVLEDLEEGRIVGTSSIIAQHGTPEEPHTYFQVLEKRKFSKSLHMGFLHQVLRLDFDYDGPTEIGGLVLLPEYRGHKERLGKFLSFVRFMYISARRLQFKNEILSELMPPFTEDGEAPVWEELGRKFTNLRYDEADKLSRKNKEFIPALFPEGDIYTCMMNPDARQTIGEVGEDTLPVKKMLESIGFKYQNRIDPFDGGPHYIAKTAQVDPVKRTIRLKLSEKAFAKDATKRAGILTALDKNRIRSIQGVFSVRKNEIHLETKQKEILKARDVTELYFLENKK
jgi:arginine N-succinyltransferase